MQKSGSLKHYGRTSLRKNSSKLSEISRKGKEDSGKFKTLIVRLRTTIILLPFGIFVVFSSLLNGLPLFLSFLIIASMINFEIFNMVENKGFRFYFWLNNFGVCLSGLNFYLYGVGVYNIEFFYLFGFLLFFIIVSIITFIESTSGRFETSIEHVGASILAYILLGIFFPFAILLKMMDLSGWVLSIVLFITWLSDTGGFIFGKFFGRHRIRFLSSPNKTIEGYIGSIIFGYTTGYILYLVQKVFSLYIEFSLFQFFIITTAVVTSAIIGDLSESTFKRWAHLKDSGEFLPGHGGFFDRFDSVIYTIPVYYVILKLFGY